VACKTESHFTAFVQGGNTLADIQSIDYVMSEMVVGQLDILSRYGSI
jgi:hypothetical protein